MSVPPAGAAQPCSATEGHKNLPKFDRIGVAHLGVIGRAPAVTEVMSGSLGRGDTTAVGGNQLMTGAHRGQEDPARATQEPRA